MFWHCDVIHAVEVEHEGTQDSAGNVISIAWTRLFHGVLTRPLVMYIPAVPTTPRNAAYVKGQYERFLEGIRPSDFPQGPSERGFIGIGTPEDIVGSSGRRAMAIPV